jgi:PAS domain S-box-containing protein
MARPMANPIPHQIQFDPVTGAPPQSPTPDPEDLTVLFANSQDLICIASNDGYFLRVNPSFERVLGWKMDQIRSKPFLEFVHPEDRERTLAALNALAHGQPVMRFENRFLCREGRYKLLSWNAFPRDDASMYAVARDITSERAHTTQSMTRDVQSQVTSALSRYFTSDESRGMVIDAANKNKGALDWLKWLIAVVVVIFSSGVVYSRFMSDNATKIDLKRHIETDLDPVKSEVSEVKDGVDQLLKLEERRAAIDQEQSEYDAKFRRLQAHRAEYQEAMSEYTALKAAGKSADKPRKTPAHLALEADLAAKRLP